MRGSWRTGVPIQEDHVLAAEAVISECVCQIAARWLGSTARSCGGQARHKCGVLR
jgi:hypothetical protein